MGMNGGELGSYLCPCPLLELTTKHSAAAARRARGWHLPAGEKAERRASKVNMTVAAAPAAGAMLRRCQGRRHHIGLPVYFHWGVTGKASPLSLFSGRYFEMDGDVGGSSGAAEQEESVLCSSDGVRS